VNANGNNNIFLGGVSGKSNIDGSGNTYIGGATGYQNISGINNVALGRLAGRSALGDGNIFLGFRAGYSETGSNRLYIDNNDEGVLGTLIYGEFDTDKLRLNAAVNIRDFMVLEPQAVAPASPEEGTVYYHATDKVLRFWNGTAWIDL
jgi:hypothetical protein